MSLTRLAPRTRSRGSPSAAGGGGAGRVGGGRRRGQRDGCRLGGVRPQRRRGRVLVVLPELFLPGYDPETLRAEPDGST